MCKTTCMKPCLVQHQLGVGASGEGEGAGAWLMVAQWGRRPFGYPQDKGAFSIPGLQSNHLYSEASAIALPAPVTTSLPPPGCAHYTP